MNFSKIIKQAGTTKPSQGGHRYDPDQILRRRRKEKDEKCGSGERRNFFGIFFSKSYFSPPLSFDFILYQITFDLKLQRVKRF